MLDPLASLLETALGHGSTGVVLALVRAARRLGQGQTVVLNKVSQIFFFVYKIFVASPVNIIVVNGGASLRGVWAGVVPGALPGAHEDQVRKVAANIFVEQ